MRLSSKYSVTWTPPRNRRLARNNAAVQAVSAVRSHTREPRSTDDDQTLVDRARRGEIEAFGELVQKYQHRIVNYVRALVADTAEAEDVAQEAFLRAFRAIRQFRGESAFKTWLYQIATNVARTHRDRRRGRREDTASEGPDGQDALAEITTGEDIEGDVIRRDRLDRALATLPVDLRETLVLRDVEGLEYREIADALDIPIGTVESRIFRARRKLRVVILRSGEGVGR